MQLYEEADRAQVPSLTKHQGAKQEENSIASLFCLAPSYLHRLEGGREGILQGAARKSPHFLGEHRTRGHEDVPAKRRVPCPEILCPQG